VRYKSYILFIILIILSCTSKDSLYDDIELIAYSWRISGSDTEWKMYCTTYVLINNSGQCKIILDGFYQNFGLKSFVTTIDKKILNDIIDSTQNILKDLDLRPKIGESLYDGPDLKIKINKGDETKTIHFYDNPNSINSKVFVKLFHSFDNFYIPDSYTKDGVPLDTILLNRRLNFIKYSIKKDSILRPLPPPPIMDEKYY
jgi:hypothetical protein